MRRRPTRSVAMLGPKIAGNLMAFPSIGGKEFTSFLESLPRVASDKSQAVIFYLSHLNVGRQHQDYLRIVQENLEAEFQDAEGQIFGAQQGDIICIYETPLKGKSIDAISHKIRAFFSEDVLSSESEEGRLVFHTHFNLRKDFPAFTGAVLEIINRQNEYLAPKTTDKWIRNAKKHSSLLTPAKYKEACDKLAKANLTKCVRSQPICKISKKTPSIEAREIYVSIAEAQKSLDLNVDLLTDPLLFQSLTHYLDQTVLKVLTKARSQYKSDNLNLNMSIPSLLSDGFLAFDQKLSPDQKKKTTIELQKMDIFADIGAYKYVKEFLHTRGYKICLDGLTHLTLPLIDWKRLGVDTLKLYWSMELLEDNSLSPDLQKSDYAKIILAHCDQAQALQWGKSVGIKHFQGWHVDQLLMPGYSD